MSYCKYMTILKLLEVGKVVIGMLLNYHPQKESKNMNTITNYKDFLEKKIEFIL